ncbi:MAG TPA: peptidoglycan bridge formation glycyltransferase FemA/FemB family protein [Anaerolineaceae bacterium]|nr:peptidoglycan bridge formation glycyltransferase FemA/FemB family protein [Anaerolineaceae bacterium]
MIRLEEDRIPQWNQLLLQFPDAHILQTSQWAEAKKQNGWSPLYFREGSDPQAPEGLALILRRQISFMGVKFSVLYAPKGPVLHWDDPYAVSRILNALQDICSQEKAIFIKIDPDVLLGTGIPGTDDEVPSAQGIALQAELEQRGWQYSQDQIQFRNSVLLDLEKSEDDLLAAMKQKTRYNIRLAARKGVQVRHGELAELSILYKMYAETAVRDGFVIRHEDYYLKTWREFIEAGMAKILIAEVENEPIAALILFHFNRTARYMFGMSTENSRDLMPNHLLQWEAMRLAKQLGCHTYDMWGAPEVFDESDSMWGVFRFKEGFNGTVTRTLGAWDYTTRPWLYRRYTETLPKLLNLLRRRGLKANKRSLND